MSNNNSNIPNYHDVSHRANQTPRLATRNIDTLPASAQRTTDNMGGSCSNTNRFSDNGVQVLLEMAREAAAGGNVDEAQKLYESAIAKAPRIKEQNVIRKEMSSIEGC